MLLLAVLLINDLQVNFLDFGADKFSQEIGEYGEVVPRVEFSLLRLEFNYFKSLIVWQKSKSWNSP